MVQTQYVTIGRKPSLAKIRLGGARIKASLYEGPVDPVDPVDPTGRWTYTDLDTGPWARPTGTDYVTYESLYAIGDNLQDVVDKVTGNKILTLPNGTFEVSGFGHVNYAALRIGPARGTYGKACRGIVGSGRGTIIRVQANTASAAEITRGNQTTGTNPLYQIILQEVNNPVLAQFQLQGLEQGCYYNGVQFYNCTGSPLVEKFYARGGARGYANSPPGETFVVSMFGSDNATVQDSEIDGRDLSGTRVTGSPLGWNTASNATVKRTYLHHGAAGMMTWWETTNISTEDIYTYSTGGGSGAKSGCSLNHERSHGVIRHVRPNMFVNGSYSGASDATANTSLHSTLQGDVYDMDDTIITEPIWDKSAFGGNVLTFRRTDPYAGSTNKVRTYPTVVKNNVTLEAVQRGSTILVFSGTRTGGTYTITMSGVTTAAIAYNASAATVAAAMNAAFSETWRVVAMNGNRLQLRPNYADTHAIGTVSSSITGGGTVTAISWDRISGSGAINGALYYVVSV